jgi:hypothetical protein
MVGKGAFGGGSNRSQVQAGKGFRIIFNRCERKSRRCSTCARSAVCAFYVTWTKQRSKIIAYTPDSLFSHFYHGLMTTG